MNGTDPEKARRANGIRRFANRLGCVNPNTICDRKTSAQSQSL